MDVIFDLVRSWPCKLSCNNFSVLLDLDKHFGKLCSNALDLLLCWICSHLCCILCQLVQVIHNSICQKDLQNLTSLVSTSLLIRFPLAQRLGDPELKKRFWWYIGVLFIPLLLGNVQINHVQCLKSSPS